MLPRRHKAPQQFEVEDGQETFTETAEDYLWAEYYVVKDAALACIRQRLNQPGYQTYHCLENLLASALNGTDYQQDLNFIADFYGDDIDKVCTLVRLLLVMSATNAVSERSASALRKVKTYLRTTMCDTRLNNLLVLHVHKDRCDSLVLAVCLNQFVSDSEHRLSLSGKF
ncbi:hypothetical protein EMCRGX_G003479 [Ephydatia muelleri]